VDDDEDDEYLLREALPITLRRNLLAKGFTSLMKGQ
jgi:hypothetical protein